jgi:hypothetical protein
MNTFDVSKAKIKLLPETITNPYNKQKPAPISSTKNDSTIDQPHGNTSSNKHNPSSTFDLSTSQHAISDEKNNSSNPSTIDSPKPSTTNNKKAIDLTTNANNEFKELTQEELHLINQEITNQEQLKKWTEVATKPHKIKKTPPRTSKPPTDVNPYSVLQDEDETPEDHNPSQFQSSDTPADQQHHKRLSTRTKNPGRGEAASRESTSTTRVQHMGRGGGQPNQSNHISTTNKNDRKQPPQPQPNVTSPTEHNEETKRQAMDIDTVPPEHQQHLQTSTASHVEMSTEFVCLSVRCFGFALSANCISMGNIQVLSKLNGLLFCTWTLTSQGKIDIYTLAKSFCEKGITMLSNPDSYSVESLTKYNQNREIVDIQMEEETREEINTQIQHPKKVVHPKNLLTETTNLKYKNQESVFEQQNG